MFPNIIPIFFNILQVCKEVGFFNQVPMRSQFSMQNKLRETSTFSGDDSDSDPKAVESSKRARKSIDYAEDEGAVA